MLIIINHWPLSLFFSTWPHLNSDVGLEEGVLALDLEGVHDVKLHHPSSSVATSNQ